MVKMVQVWSLGAMVNTKKTVCFSLIVRVILSAGAMLIFSVSFQIDQMPVGKDEGQIIRYILYYVAQDQLDASPPLRLLTIRNMDYTLQ
jgi:hypothetical protein